MLLSLVISDQVAAQTDFTVERTENIIEISADGNDYRLEICIPEMIRVRMAGINGFQPPEDWMVTMRSWPSVKYTFSENDSACFIETERLKVIVTKSPFHVSFYNSAGKILNSDIDEKSSMQYADENPICTKMLLAGEHFFGFGERMDFIDQLGKRVELNVGRGRGYSHEVGAYNILESNYSPIPFFMSTRGYGIFFHNAWKTTWDMGNTSAGRYTFSAGGGELDYYFILGPALTDIIEKYTALTGTTPLLPRYAMGLHVGTYSGGTWCYEHLTSQEYVVELARTFRRLGIPLDILHLDSTWRIFGKISGKGGTSFEWRMPGFPDPQALFDSLYAQDINAVGLHIRPRIDNGNFRNLRDQAQEAGVTYPENGEPGELINYFEDDAVDWWWENGLKPLAEMGCKFVKIDEGSAFGHKANESDMAGPQGEDIGKLHNLFPVAYARAPYKKFQEYTGVRGMNHAREGYAGIQRYPFIFAGDWPSEWQYFAPVIRGGINISLSGVGAWTHCMGGFEHVADPELYIRWCQFGMFSPIAMLFGMEHPHYKEPWNYGEEALQIFTRYDKLRYRLIPYLYSNFYQMYLTGKPVMQALVLQYPDDRNTYSIDDQYFFGDDFLVCPVTVKAAKTRALYLPKGVWYDYFTGEKTEGGRYINVTTPLDKLPLYVKAGAIIPMQPDMNYVGEKPLDLVTLDIYPAGTSSFGLYDDDGLSLEYKNGNYAITRITCTGKDKATEIVINTPEGNYRVPERSWLMKIHAADKPEKVSVNNIRAEESEGQWSYDEEGILWVGIGADISLPVTVIIDHE